MPYAPPRHGQRRVSTNRKQQQKDYNRTRRTGQDFYNSKEWYKLRNWFVKQNPLCVHCKAEGRATPVQVVDHIIPVKAGGARLSSDNLRSLCNRHHAIVTVEQNKKYGITVLR